MLWLTHSEITDYIKAKYVEGRWLGDEQKLAMGLVG